MIRPPPPWPNGARCAVGFSFDVDADSVVHASKRGGALDEAARGRPHALRPACRPAAAGRLFAGYGIPITCFVPGWVIEAYRKPVEFILSAPNEIAHHGYFHEWPNQQDLDAERRTLAAGIERIVELTGRPPAGYRAPYYGLSRNSFDLLIEAGFLYDSSLFADDVPIVLEGTAGRLIELPPPASVDDYNQYVSSRAFDYLMTISPPARAHRGLPGRVRCVVGDRRPVRAGLASRGQRPAGAGGSDPRTLVEHMMAKGGVWFATLGRDRPPCHRAGRQPAPGRRGSRRCRSIRRRSCR